MPAEGDLSWRKAGVVGQGLPKLPGSGVRGGRHNFVVRGNGQVVGEEFVFAHCTSSASVITRRGCTVDGEFRTKAVQPRRGLRGEFRGVWVHCEPRFRAREGFSVGGHFTWAVG